MRTYPEVPGGKAKYQKKSCTREECYGKTQIYGGKPVVGLKVERRAMPKNVPVKRNCCTFQCDFVREKQPAYQPGTPKLPYR
jgi:hypothetical protein